MSQQLIKTILSSRAISVPPKTTLSEAAVLMEKNEISCLVVIDNKKPVGIFTERDLLVLASRSVCFNGIEIRDVMSKSVITANIDIDIFEAYRLLETNKIRHLVIVDDEGGISGVITQTDIINNLGLEYFIELKNVSKIMTRNVITVDKRCSVRDGVSIMAKYSISCIVIEENNYPVGILTERNVVRLFRTGADIENLSIEKVMSQPVKTISPDTTVHEAASILNREKIRRLVVIGKDGRISGIVTQSDIIKTLEKKYIDLLEEIIREKEKTLQETEKILSEKIVLDNILRYSTNMAIIATDLNFRVCYYNPGAERIFGYGAEEIIGRNLTEIHAKEKVDPFHFEKTMETIRAEGTFRHILELKRGEGIRYIGSTMSGIRDKNHTLAGFVLIAQDITERKKAEEEAQRDFNIQAVLNWLLSLSLEDISLDETLQRALDLILSVPWLAFESRGSIFLTEDNHDILVLRAQKELPAPLHKACARIKFGMCLCGRAALNKEIEFADCIDGRHEIEYEGMSPHGHYIVPILFAGKTLGIINIYLKEGHRRNQKKDAFLTSVANALAGVIVRKRMEEDIIAANTQLQTLIQAIPDAVFFKDSRGCHLIVNKACEKLLGLPQAEIAGKTNEQLLPPDMADKSRMSDEKAMKNPEPLRTEEQFKGKDGREVILDTVKVPLFDETGNIVGLVGVSRDITERRKMEEELLKAKKLESIGLLVSGIAHDFNNLLTAILGNISLAKMHINPEEEIFKMLDIAEGASIHASDLIKQITTLSEKAPLIKSTLSPEELVKTSVSFALKDSNIKYVFNFPDALSPIEVDEGQIRQVIHNIALNARESMPEGGIVNVLAENITLPEDKDISLKSGKYIKVSIKDHGVGIPREYLSKVFDPYFTTKDTWWKKGMGLGLSTCYSIVKNHGGLITVESEVGVGTTFHIYLPALDG